MRHHVPLATKSSLEHQENNRNRCKQNFCPKTCKTYKNRLIHKFVISFRDKSTARKNKPGKEKNKKVSCSCVDIIITIFTFCFLLFLLHLIIEFKDNKMWQKKKEFAEIKVRHSFHSLHSNTRPRKLLPFSSNKLFLFLFSSLIFLLNFLLQLVPLNSLNIILQV